MAWLTTGAGQAERIIRRLKPEPSADRIRRRSRRASAVDRSLVGRYIDDPVGYARDILGVSWWAKQIEIAEALIKHRRVFVKASHSIGKSHLCGGLVNWFYDTYCPSITLTTAPSYDQVVDVLWKEIRVQRKERPGLLRVAPRLRDSADHFAVGLSTAKSDAFQGRHEEHVLIIFDECVGIKAQFWEAAQSMMTGANPYMLAICNPTDTSSPAYFESQDSEKWHVIEVSALEHPNITAGLAGLPVPYPAAVQPANVDQWVRDWATPIERGDFKPGDFEWRGLCYRPGPLAESRMLGRWPTQGIDSVWSDVAWHEACRWQPIPPMAPVTIGCDVARFGDDLTSILVRRGPVAVHHERHQGWSTQQTAGRLKELCREYAWEGQSSTDIPVNVDDDGVGGGVTDARTDEDGTTYRFVACSGARRARQSSDYPNRRSEVWFVGAQSALDGDLCLAHLDQESRNSLRKQLMQPKWKIDGKGRRVVEPKAETKKRLGASPDDADTLNLCYANESGTVVTSPGTFSLGQMASPTAQETLGTDPVQPVGEAPAQGAMIAGARRRQSAARRLIGR